jgi:hypothetical protein
LVYPQRLLFEPRRDSGQVRSLRCIIASPDADLVKVEADSPRVVTKTEKKEWGYLIEVRLATPPPPDLLRGVLRLVTTDPGQSKIVVPYEINP